MLAPDSKNAPNIAVITLVCGWVFSGTAILAVFLHLWSRRIIRSFKWDDILVFLAAVIAIALVAHTSWIIIREGFGKSETITLSSHRATLIKVGLLLL